MQAPPPVESPESQWRPTLASGVTQTRSFSRLFPGFPYPERHEIEIVNASAAVLTLRVHDRTETIPVGGKKRVRALDVGGAINGYSLTASATTGAGEVVAYERGGVTRPYTGAQ